MKFSDIKKSDLSFSEADAYLDQYENELDEIYVSDTADGGDKGWVWRQLFGKPKEISPLLLYLTERLKKSENDVEKYKKVARRNSKEKNQLTSVVAESQKLVKNVQANNRKLEAQNEQMKGRLDDDTARCLMESISYLATLCRNNNLPFDVNSLPHYEKLNVHQIKYLKLLMEK